CGGWNPRGSSAAATPASRCSTGPPCASSPAKTWKASERFFCGHSSPALDPRAASCPPPRSPPHREAPRGPPPRAHAEISFSLLFWEPRLVGPRHAHARDLRVDEVRLAAQRGFLRAAERGLELRRRFHDFPFDAEPLGDPRHVHVRAAEVVVKEVSGLNHA